MKIFENLSNTLYLNKTDRAVYHERVFKLQEECSKLNLFVNTHNSRELPSIEKNEPTFLYEEGKKIGSIIAKKTYYFFNGNTCIIYNKSGYDRIIRILVKRPDKNWDVTRVFDDDNLTHLNINNEYVEIYDWWNVDWMQCGKNDYGYATKQGSWWKPVYQDICGIYEYVAKHGVEYVLDSVFSTYKKEGV